MTPVDDLLNLARAAGAAGTGENRTMRRKVLFIAEAVTLAHVGRMLSLAQGLDPQRYEVVVACDPRYRAAIGEVAVPLVEIQTIPSQQFFDALDRGSPIYGWRDLLAYVEQDRALIQAQRPDVIVGDFRLSLAASARLEGKPYLSVTNAYWSPYAQIRPIVPEIPLTRAVGVRAAQWLFDLFRPIAFARHAAPVNRMLAHFGLPRLAADLRHAYTEADQVLYSDAAELVPHRPLPANHHFIGPVQWSPRVPLPSWWNDMPSDEPLVYVNLGSSGHGKLLPEMLEVLAAMPVTVMAATAGRVALKDLSANEFVADFLPGDQAVRRASLVICNGGSPTCYQALAAGRPVIGLPINLDQYLNMSLVREAGAGLLIRSGQHSAPELRRAVEGMLRDGRHAQRAGQIAQDLARYRPAQTLAGLIDRLG